MNPIATRIFASLSVCIACNAMAVEAPLIAGQYKADSPGLAGAVLAVANAPSNSSSVSVTLLSSAPQCSGSFNIRLQFVLPSGYKGDEVKYSSATCTGVEICSGVHIVCKGVGPVAVAFAQPQKSMVTGRSPFWGGLATFVSIGAPVLGEQHGEMLGQSKFEKKEAEGSVILLKAYPSVTEPAN